MNSLVVKNISQKLSYNEREELLTHFGAQSVTNLPNYSFAIFADELKAREAMTRLHQLLVLGQRLRVEFAIKTDNSNESNLNSCPPIKEPHIQQKSSEESLQAFKEEKLRQFLNQLNYISPALGLNYLPSPLLRYSYPTATPLIVNNIAHTLLAHPRFYTQVLHLMNKMNLPVPFEPILNAPNILNFDTITQTSNVNNFDIKSVSIASSESELEISDSEDNVDKSQYKITNKVPKKVVKKLKTGFVGEKALALSENFESKRRENVNKNKKQIPDVFEVANTSGAKTSVNIEVNIVSDCRALNQLSRSGDNEPAVQTSGFGVLTVDKHKECEKSVEIVWNPNDMISDEELRSNRLEKSQWINYNVFKGYVSGQTSIRLYIKNIDKSVETNDLMRIYSKFIDWNSEVHKNMFDIRLMKSGRMKGQAFITLPEESIAEKALNETNGYLFNGKPIVVSFARSVRPKAVDQ